MENGAHPVSCACARCFGGALTNACLDRFVLEESSGENLFQDLRSSHWLLICQSLQNCLDQNDQNHHSYPEAG